MKEKIVKTLKVILIILAVGGFIVSSYLIEKDVNERNGFEHSSGIENTLVD